MLSDASDFRRRPGSSVLTGLLSTAALLHDRTGMTVAVQLVTAGDAGELVSQLRRVAPALSGGAYLVHTDPVRARAAQDAVTGTMAVITDRQTAAVALVAAALSALRRARIAPAAARLVIAGAECNPLVAALALAAGIGEFDSCGLDDGRCRPVRRPIRPGAVVIDLVGGPARWYETGRLDRPRPSSRWTNRKRRCWRFLACSERPSAPGVHGGLAGHLVCALGLVERTPPGQVLPDLSDPGLTDPSLAADIAGAHRPQDLFPVR